MSRIRIFDLAGNVAAEIHANCSRTWAINDAAESTVTLPAEWVLDALDFGRLALVEHDKLPAWAGMIDTPWTATLPVGVTIYPCEYLFNIRTPDHAMRLEGSTGAIARQLLSIANDQESLPILAGEIEEDNEREEKIDQRPIWEQLKGILSTAGMEMRFRPAMEAGRLVIYMDIQRLLGMNTGYLLHDGEGGNLEISGAEIGGQIINRMIGIGDQQSQESRRVTAPQENEESAKRFRLRSAVRQFDGDISLGQLTKNVQTELERVGQPVLTLTANALDVGDTFSYLNLGNTLIVHASRLYLPGGVRGWRGLMRIYAMAYNEDANVVEMTLEGIL